MMTNENKNQKQKKNNYTMHTNTHLSIKTIENKTKRHMNENQNAFKKKLIEFNDKTEKWCGLN